MKGFDDSQKSTFKYWFAHWCAYQMVALSLHVWKPKHLLHDMEKPWLRLFMPYPKVKKWHREHNRHHLQYGIIHGFDKIDWEALVIDWECSHFTKASQPFTARQYAEQKKLDLTMREAIQTYCYPVLDRLHL